MALKHIRFPAPYEAASAGRDLESAVHAEDDGEGGVAIVDEATVRETDVEIAAATRVPFVGGLLRCRVVVFCYHEAHGWSPLWPSSFTRRRSAELSSLTATADTMHGRICGSHDHRPSEADYLRRQRRDHGYNVLCAAASAWDHGAY